MNDLRSRQTYRDQRSKRKSGCGCIVPILLTVVIVALIVFFRSQTQSYANLNAGFKVAHVCAISTPASRPTMYVHVILYGNDGNITFDHQYAGVEGNQVQLQGDIIKYWPGLNPLFQSGYKLTRLEGYYNDPNIERTYKPDPIYLNGGDDNFYKTVHGLPSVTPVVEAIYDKPLSLKVDGHPYDIFVSQDGLSASKVNNSLACGLKTQPRS
jgi:hypothetical protein